jgi:4-amino-4-deoxy-L-arabinose transferase-like glycosyltransferase
VFYDPRVQDLHPPTFHLLSNALLSAGLMSHWPLVPRVRALAALFGIAAVVAMFLAMRQGFDRRTSLTAAALVAVSPYAVMLSREARNYSCAMLLVTCALGAVLAIVSGIDGRRSAWAWWVVWVAASAAGLYVHYFTLFAFVAQTIVLASVARRSGSAAVLPTLCVAVVVTVVAFLPWLPTLVAQQASPEQRWLTFAIYGSSPLQVPYKIASAWQTMLLGKAWDLGQPVYDITRAVALVIYLCVLAAIAWTLMKPSSSPDDRRARLLFAIAAVTILEYVGAMIVQQKDFVSEVRYQYAYYVPFAAAVAWVFARRLPVAATLAILAAGLINTVMVDLDVESWKGTDPPPVLARLEQASRPTLVVGGSGSFNETVVYQTILNEYLRRNSPNDQFVAIVKRTPLYASFDIHADPAIFWSAFSTLRPEIIPATVMVQSSGMQPAEYPASVRVTSATGEGVDCRGIDLDDRRFADTNTLIRPLYRRYVCDVAAGR